MKPNLKTNVPDAIKAHFEPHRGLFNFNPGNRKPPPGIVRSSKIASVGNKHHRDTSLDVFVGCFKTVPVP